MAKTDMAVASAATLVAAQCVEAAESMGAEREHLASVVSSAVNVRSHDDITTLTAAAATALRGAATLKARALKEVWNITTVTPIERGIGIGLCGKGNNNNSNSSTSDSGESVNGENFLGACSQELLAKGTELLKRTRKGDLHLKIVSVYIHRTGQVMLKMKSKHVAGTITKKKKTWAGRHLFDDGEQRKYFGMKTESRGIVEFECRNQREYDIWTQGVSRLLSFVAKTQNR
ncbi:putative pleckstrin-like, plant [Lupinus albus]|uniref:Putative pleckstrin-like, plant n=1 Tax=Lupinus albus TaxID=3870 RepID=A0A6A4QXN5_LUPAL|nr:putative pleckstrin-like, plant [Lupinus albus]